MAKFEFIVRRNKRCELYYYHSPLFTLLLKTTEKLRLKYWRQRRTPDWGINFSVYRSLVIENVPESEFHNLARVFEGYIQRRVVVKRHKHRWVYVKQARNLIWVECANCDADQPIIPNDYLEIARKIILPYWLSLKKGEPLYKTAQERMKIRQFLERNKDWALQNAAEEIDCNSAELREKAQKMKSEKRRNALLEQIRRLEEERQACATANFIL